MKHIKSLASQTAIYGVSSILGRLLNYLLVPLHTSLFSAEEYGPVAYLYAVGAFLLIFYTHGMETTFFRFSSKDINAKSYDYALSSILLVSVLLSLIVFIFSNSLANLVDFPGEGHLIRWLVLIILIDSITAIPFARMRLENKAKKFVIIKIVNITINIGLQLVFLVVLPSIIQSGGNSKLIQWANSIDDLQLGIGYIFLANLIANVCLIVLVFPYFKSFSFRLNMAALRPMFLYALPLLLMGIAGTISEQLDKILVKDLLSNADLGIYAQTFKLSVFILLAIQAFRYAGEPFFFSRAKDINAPELFASVLYYFVLFELIIFVAISLNVEMIGLLMLQRPEYRVALYLVPIIMFGKLFYGIYVNVSIWFKLKDKTIYGMYFTLLGAAITIVGNMIFIPMFGYTGSALTIVIVYVTMTVTCYQVGKKYFPVPYNISKISAHIAFGVLLTWLSFMVKLPNVLVDNLLNIGVTLAYIYGLWLFEKRNLKEKTY